MRHLVGVGLGEGWPGRGVRDVAAAGGIVRQPVEPVHQAQYVGHEDVGHGKAFGQPLVGRQYRLHVLESVLIAAAGLAIVVFGVWFLLFAGASPVPLGMNL